MIYQKPTKTITGAYATTAADNGYRIICNSGSAFEITLHTATGSHNFELEIDNIGAGVVTVNSQTLKQYTHAHVGNNGGTAWSVVVGGGSMSKAEIEAILTGEISTHSHALAKATVEAVLTGEITSHTHPASAQLEPLTNGDEATPEILFYGGDVIMVEV